MSQPSFGKNALIILASESVEAANTVLDEVERLGGRIVHVYAPRVLIGDIPPEIEARVRAVANVRTLYRRRVDLGEVTALGPDVVRAVKGWNRGFAASFRALKSARAGEGKSWGAPGYAPEGPVQPPQGVSDAEELGSRAPFRDRRALARDRSAYLIGKVAVNVILVQGQAPPYTFNQIEIDTVVAEIQDGLGWLGNQEPMARISWFYEFRGVSLNLDPALIPDFAEDTWRDAALAELGYPASWGGLLKFVDDRRAALGTDWTFAIFVTRFPLWHFAYAYKPRVVMDYDLDGWGIDDMDHVTAHEAAHIFGAADEYAESKCDPKQRFGYLRVENGNCELGTQSPVPCIMARNTWAMCDYTRGQLGWRDSNGNGILDPIDLPGAGARSWWQQLLQILVRWLGLTPRDV
jgi:hypothetical protein